MNGARFIRNDLSLVVEELLEEKDEHDRSASSRSTDIPLLQLANIDFSYGPVQVLFGVNFEVQKGETVALLGTNGAGKSTALRVISGLAVPERGVVRLNGQNITYVAPEGRAKYLSMMQLPGGHGVFGNLTVEQNLAVSARLNAESRTQVNQRIAGVYDLFPELAEHRKQVASSMSGGQQQMLALGRVLIHDPELLMIDELSLGLAPLVVQRLLEVVEELKARGPDDDHRGAVAQRGDRPRRPGDLPREGTGPLRGVHRRPARTRRPGPGGVLRDRGRLMTLATVVTWNLVFKGVIGGLITALVAMGIVLVYRSSRVINFAVGSIGIPATALFASWSGSTGGRTGPRCSSRSSSARSPACSSSWR